MTDRPGRYARHGGEPRLVRSGVLFLDVLGTKQLASDAEAPATLLRLDAALKRARERSQLDERWSWADSSWFSDNLAIAAPLGRNRLDEEGIIGTIIVGAMWLQYLLAIDGFFTRGGFAVGQQFMDRRVNFGPALVRAVELEQSAVYPRIILDDTATAVVMDHSGDYARGADNPFETELMVDEDDVTFISYLSIAYEADDIAEAVDLLERHRSAVKVKLEQYGTTGPIGEKYAWTADYHNAFCQVFDRRRRSLQITPKARAHSFRSFNSDSRHAVQSSARSPSSSDS